MGTKPVQKDVYTLTVVDTVGMVKSLGFHKDPFKAMDAARDYWQAGKDDIQHFRCELNNVPQFTLIID